MEHKPVILIYSDIEKIWGNSYSELGAMLYMYIAMQYLSLHCINLLREY
jgi:hypothetical protein